ncbi:MAG: tetratricopeptide repeat protein, partial [Myxococcales bacterium]|nr:tetratricopeptide repeat protein [Myxococcales bacterium]
MSRRTLAGAAILAAAIAWVGLDQARCERRGLWSLAAWLSGREHDAAAAWVLGALTTLRPDCALAHRDLGAALYRADRFEPALEAARRAAALDPGDSEAPRLIGNALMHLGRHGEAVDWFARAAGATELEGRPSTALRNLEGFARYKAGDLPGALAIFESLAEREPDFVLGWVNRALTLERLG